MRIVYKYLVINNQPIECFVFEKKNAIIGNKQQMQNHMETYTIQ